MKICNNFRIIGTVYGNARQVKKRRREVVIFNLLVSDSYNKFDKSLLKFYCMYDAAEKAKVICVNGNQVAVIGQIVSAKNFDESVATVVLKIYLMCEDIKLLTIGKRPRLSDNTFASLIDNYQPPSLDAPKLKLFTPDYKKYHKRAKRGRKKKDETNTGTNESN